KKALDEVKKAVAADKALGPDGGVKPPWEADGRRWHTRDRVARNGRPARWDGDLLARVVDRVHALGDGLFAPTDWSQRPLVKVRGSARGAPGFFTAIPGHGWVVTLKFRVVRNAFRKESLDAQLRLAPFHEASPPVLCDTPRVGLLNFPGGVQEVVITASTD